MPKLTKKFVVFHNDSEIFKYIPEDDDKFIGDTANLYDTLREAKAYALSNLAVGYNEEKRRIIALAYKDFK